MRKLRTIELNRLSVEAFKQAQKNNFVVVLDNIRSMYNVGSLFRTADAFLAKELYLCGITPQPPHREIHKTAIGATESVSWTYAKDIEECLKKLKDEDYTIVGLEQTDQSIMLEDYVMDVKKKYAIICGNEVEGISNKALPYLDACIEIPQFGTKHSLNVSVAGGIILHHFALRFSRSNI